MQNDEAGRVRVPSRRDFVALGVGALLIGAVPLARRRQRTLLRRTLPVMGTIADLGVVHHDARFAQGALDAAAAELVRVERLMSYFADASDVGRANRGAHAAPVEIDAATANVIDCALRFAYATGGAFDPCLGKAVALWDVKQHVAPPPPSALRRFAGRLLYRELERGTHQGRPVVVFHDRDLAIDLGGIAKGYGVDRAVAALRAWGITDGLVNVGGDLYALGVSEDGDPWRVGVQSPEHPQQLATTLRISDRAVATSGDYMQYFDHAGRRYHHLLDPRTAEPTLGPRHSLTVAAHDCITADAAATALFGSSTVEAKRVLARLDSRADLLHQA